MAARIVGKLIADPMRYVAGKPLERWLMIIDLPARKLAFANDPAVVETVMLDKAGTFPKSVIVHDLLAPLIGSGVFGQPGGAAVKATRRIYARCLAAIPEATVREASEIITAEYVDRWLAEPGRPVPASEAFSRLTVDIVSQCTLGLRFDAERSLRFTQLFLAFHHKAAPLVLMLARQDEATRRRLIDDLGIAGIGQEMRALMRDSFVRPLLKSAQAGADAPFLKALADAGAGMDEESVLDEVAVMLLAGHETTAATMSWMVYELALRPKEQDQLAAALAGTPSPAAPAWMREGPDRVADMVGRETLRLYPPIGFFLRQSGEETTFRRATIPAGSFFVVSPWTLHRHRKLWSRPDDFAPGRWADGEPAPARTSYMPFGLGARSCPGARFAAIEMDAIIRGLLPRARLTLRKGRRPKPLGNLTSRPDREIFLEVAQRRPLTAKPEG